jgi:hypothetical protein
MTVTFEEWRHTREYREDAFAAECNWAGPVYAYDGGFIGIDPLGGLTIPICNQEFHFYTLDEAERCLWEEWVRDEFGDLL